MRKKKRNERPAGKHKLLTLTIVLRAAITTIFSNSRAIGMVVVRLSSVTDVLWLNGRS